MNTPEKEIYASAPEEGRLTAAIIKAVKALHSARGRREAGAFVAEGTKCVLDTAGHFTPQRLIATAAWLEAHPEVAHRLRLAPTVAARRDMERLSALSTPPEVVGVFALPQWNFDPAAVAAQGLALALDGVQDPGNLGTIARAADWFGVRTVLCSPDCADPFSPKAVMATMGALARVRIVRTSLPDALSGLKALGLPVLGTFLGGENLFTTPQLPRRGSRSPSTECRIPATSAP